MASPEKPTGTGLETGSLPWTASPGSQDPLESTTAAAEGFTEGPTSAEEAIGGASHSAPGHAPEPTRDAGAVAAEALDRAVTVRDAIEAAIVARPLKAVGIAAAIGFLAALLFRR
jgi:DUF883 C-terminal glycine zipper region